MRVLADVLVTGLPLVPAFMGIYIVFMLRNDFDLTVEGSYTMGGAVTAALLTHTWPVWLTMLVATGLSAAMGCVTAALHTTLKIPIVLAGLIMSIGLFSANLRILDGPTISLAGVSTGLTRFQELERDQSDRAVIVIFSVGLVVLLTFLAYFFQTDFGLALRVSGVNSVMARSLGVNPQWATASSLVLANGLTGLSGSIVVQNQRFADINMGSGILLAGIGGVLIGDLLLAAGSNIRRAVGAVLVGTLAYRAILAISLRAGLQASDLKAVSAAALVTVFILRSAVRAGWQRRSTRAY